ncbi:uncharacterized protein PHALS_05438 [Plasmopara halstedii]|uniref:Uncharacterized protein n=1 Tax=Plasmopara halstedii TaxID=4781 RepID=A0A0P1AAV2_PLAHL|nr:uncharacterized protein PHALS_05438 [Plasmopara halstedii]CEG37660.1 hypothetical protein PHALS_05438 [Plasmopara halstedii]|eukprot:XP_024574029.1 hypothetical protein PHALS_05438 [Plasmopara halstedii]
MCDDIFYDEELRTEYRKRHRIHRPLASVEEIQKAPLFSWRQFIVDLCLLHSPEFYCDLMLDFCLIGPTSSASQHVPAEYRSSMSKENEYGLPKDAFGNPSILVF